MVELLGVDGGSEIGSSNGMSGGNREVNLKEYTLGEYTFGSESIIELIYSVGRSGGKVSSSVGISGSNREGNLEVYPLVE